MTLKEMKNIQVAANALTEIIHNILDCKPYEAPDYIQDAYYGANTLWIKLQELIEEEGKR